MAAANDVNVPDIAHHLAEALANRATPFQAPPAPPGPYISSDKVKHAAYLAYSVTSNVRHQECAVHGAFSQAVTELLQPYSNLSPEIHRTVYVEFETKEHKQVIPIIGNGHHRADSDLDHEHDNLSDGDEDLGGDQDEAGVPAARILRNRAHLVLPKYVDQLDQEDSADEEEEGQGNGDAEGEGSDDTDGDEDEEDTDYEPEDVEWDNISGAGDTTKSLKHGLYKEFIPDMTVVHSRLRMMRMVDTSSSFKRIRHFLHRHGIQSKHFCLVLMGKFKRGPHRTIDLEGDLDQYNSDIADGLLAAEKDLLSYCSYYFAAYPHIEEVLAFAACGVYWVYKIVQRKDVPRYHFEDEDFFEDDQDKMEAFYDDWSEAVELGTHASDAKLTEIRDTFFHDLACDGYLGEQSESSDEEEEDKGDDEDED